MVGIKQLLGTTNLSCCRSSLDSSEESLTFWIVCGWGKGADWVIPKRPSLMVLLLCVVLSALRHKAVEGGRRGFFFLQK